MEFVYIVGLLCFAAYEIYNRYATHKERMNGIVKQSDGYMFITTYKTTETNGEQ